MNRQLLEFALLDIMVWGQLLISQVKSHEAYGKRDNPDAKMFDSNACLTQMTSSYALVAAALVLVLAVALALPSPPPLSV